MTERLPLGDVPTGAKKPRPSQTPEEKLRSTSPVMRMEGAFQIAYEKQWHVPLIINYGRDRALLKRLIDQLGEPRVRVLIDAFFRAVRPVTQGGDPVVARSRYANIMDFSTHAQYLLLKDQRGPQLTDRTAENVAAIRRATGKDRS